MPPLQGSVVDRNLSYKDTAPTTLISLQLLRSLQRLRVSRAFHVRRNDFKIRRRPNFDLFVLHKIISFLPVDFASEYSAPTFAVQLLRIKPNTFFTPSFRLQFRAPSARFRSQHDFQLAAIHNRAVSNPKIIQRLPIQPGGLDVHVCG